MGIRIQPRDIDVPKSDPFENDLLGRKEPVEVLTCLVGSLEGPCVLAVDAAWGNGKTTFLNMWAQYLRKQEFPVVTFNAWETDFSGEPFIALSRELRDGFQKCTDDSIDKKIQETTKEVLRWTVPNLVRLAATTIPVAGTGMGEALASYVEGKWTEYQQGQESVTNFRAALQEMATDISTRKDGKPLIVMIDELDRCRPSYAVELLEVAKHLFAVDHIVFVLAVNRTELEHSIKALYGNDFGAKEYLFRFFDVDFRLPEPDRAAFINQMLVSTKIDDYFKKTQNTPLGGNDEVVKKWLQFFFYDRDLSIRRVAQAIHRLGLVFASLRSDQSSRMEMAAVALIVRTIDSNLYQKFIHGEATDDEVVDMVFSRPGAKILRQMREGLLFEAAVILALDGGSWTPEEPNKSQLLRRYFTLIGNDGFHSLKRMPRSELFEKVIPGPNWSDLDRARAIIILVLWGGLTFGIQGHAAFREAVRRLELFSPSLIDDR